MNFFQKRIAGLFTVVVLFILSQYTNTPKYIILIICIIAFAIILRGRKKKNI